MERRKFIQHLAPLLAAAPFIGQSMTLKELHSFGESLRPSPLMPVLFLGHGSPMNAIEENEFVQGFRKIAAEIERPKAVICISAHWETRGTFVTAMPYPRTIHDFGGFPRELFEVQYTPPGSPHLAGEIKELMTQTEVGLDHAWGLDHGAWSVIKHMYPLADVPVIQMSIDYTRGPAYHFELAKSLSSLRKKGVLIVGSGNMVHNLRMVAWEKLHESFAYDWAEEANEKMKAAILQREEKKLIDYHEQGKAFEMAIPSPEHFLPLLYVLGLQGKNESTVFFNDKPVAGSLYMTGVRVG